jgi:lipoprotein-anchoring transpeptidase ErfK/SrfK
MVSGVVGRTSNVQDTAAAAKNSFDLSLVELPGDLGQSGAQVYVPASKHTLRGYFLDYWRANGAASVYGNPISEPYASADGRYSQAFENGIFQFYPELVWTDSPSVLLQPIGSTALSGRVDTFRRDGRRGAGGGDSRHAAWKPLPVDSRGAQRAISEGGQYVEATGHTLSREFNDWYQSHEGWAYLGNPLSQPVAERGMVVQYFEGALLMRDENDVVSMAPLGKELASRLEIDTTTVARNGLPDYDETYFWTATNPNPLGDPESTGRKWIDVNISTQTLTAYQGNTPITQTLVSTGIEPNHTEEGTFHVRYKLPKTDMAGTTGPDGAVVELGQQAADDAGGDESAYIVKDVPDVMYINADAEALHGAYWHNNFGNRMSHGCINLPLDMAHFLYGWAPLGTMVYVHE